MVYIAIPYIPDGPVTKALKKTLKASGKRYKLGYLGELMDENYTAAKTQQHLYYAPEDLKKLKHVAENPDVVDIAFAVLEQQLREAGHALPTVNEKRIPYYPNWAAILGYTALNALLMTVAITLIVLLLPTQIALMTTLIVLVSILGAAAFVLTHARCVTYVDV